MKKYFFGFLMFSGLAASSQTVVTSSRLNHVVNVTDTTKKVEAAPINPTVTTNQKQATQLPATPQPEAPTSETAKPEIQSTRRKGL